MATSIVNVITRGLDDSIVEYEGLSTDPKPTDCGPNSKYTENDTGSKFFFDGTAWQPLATSGGGGGGEYTLPTASSTTKGGVKIGEGLRMTGEVLSATGGSGDGKFVVNVSKENDEWTADKTPQEILAAYEADDRVVCSVETSDSGEIPPLELPCTVAMSVAEGAVVDAIFSGISGLEPYNPEAITVLGSFSADGDGVATNVTTWEVYNTAVITPLPTASANTKGGIKVGSGLSIDSDGVLSAQSNSIIHTATFIEEQPIVFDVDYATLLQEIVAGKDVTLRAIMSYTEGGETNYVIFNATVLSLSYVADQSSPYELSLSILVSGTETIVSVYGSSGTDPVTITLE